MKLDAVTVCVHESDSLALTLGNRAQFDRWLIVTVPGDQATIRFCREHDLECHLSTTLQRDGIDILDGSNRTRAMAEGAEALGRSGWVATISSYVLLPRLFRAVLDAMALDSACRYRLGGARPCTNRKMFEQLRSREPWSGTESGDGLFDLADRRVAAVREARLPITALLLGDSALHWGAGILGSERGSEQGGRGIALRGLLERIATRPRLLVAGYYPGLDAQTWAPLCAQVFLADDFGLNRRWEDALAVNAATQLLDRWRAETAGLDTMVALDAAGDAIADRSLDAIYLPGEVSAERLAAGLPLWRRKMKEHGVICGDLYGRPHWPEASLAVAQLIGTPDEVTLGGFWHKRVDRVALPALSDMPRTPCVVLANPLDSDHDRALVSLHAVRLQWAGRLVVVDRQADTALVAACLRYGAEFQRTTKPVAPSLTLTAGTLAVQPIAPLFAARWMQLAGSLRTAAVGIVRRLRGREQKRPPAILSGPIGGAWSVPVAKASTLAESAAGERAFIRYGEDPQSWSPAALSLWSSMEADMRARLKAPITVAADSTVVVVVDRTSVPQFERNRRCWQFADDVPVVIACDGAAADGLPTPVGPEDLVPLAPEIMTDPRSLLRHLMRRVRTSRVILLPAGAQPLPGASLFTAPAWNAMPIVLHTTVEVKRVNGAVPLPWKTEPLLLSARTEHIHRLCEIDVPLLPTDDLGSWMRKAIVQQGGGWEIFNVESWGWRMS